MKLSVIKADITTLTVDAIVNAANGLLVPGGGVCGAIHAAAGPGLAEYCGMLEPVSTGHVAVTPAFRLRAQIVIHAVGPTLAQEVYGSVLLSSAYGHALLAADDLHCRSIAFPCISTGIYGYPCDVACAVAVASARRYIARNLTECVFCVFSDADLDLYKAALGSA